MTEDKWFSGWSGWDLLDMLIHLQRAITVPLKKEGRRKLRLYGCACCRLMWGLLDDAERQAVEIAERFADGQATDGDLLRAFRTTRSATLSGYPATAKRFAGQAAHATADKVANRAAEAGYYTWQVSVEGQVIDKEPFLPPICDLLRDIFGNPFKPAKAERRWLTWNDGALPKMAQGIYDERALDRLPLLADALEDAGCTDAAILEHCRGPGPHVRGCWVVDLLRRQA